MIDRPPPAPILPAPVSSKSRYYTAFERGDFGNRTETFTKPADAFSFPAATRFAIRSTEKGFKTLYNLTSNELWSKALELGTHGLPFAKQHYSVMAPDQAIVWQGELMRTERGLYAYYSRAKKPMKTALESAPEHAYGLAAESLLVYMDPSSRDDLRELEADYPDHVVELSVYDRSVGTIPSRNTIFWEARLY